VRALRAVAPGLEEGQVAATGKPVAMRGLTEQPESSAADRANDVTDKEAMLPVPSAASRIARFDLSESRTASPVKPPRHGSAGVGMGRGGGGGMAETAAAPELELTQVRETHFEGLRAHTHTECAVRRLNTVALPRSR
jgi:hypothetical protein